MDKKKKNIIAIVLVAVIIIAIIVAVVASKKGKDDVTQNGSTTAAQVETTVSSGGVNGDADVTTAENANGDLPVAGDETTAKSSKDSKKGSKKGNKNNEETNYWDNISIIEEPQNKEPKTNKKGETVTEEYPGQDDGWSPIVSPDDLEK